MLERRGEQTMTNIHEKYSLQKEHKIITIRTQVHALCLVAWHMLIVNKNIYTYTTLYVL